MNACYINVEDTDSYTFVCQYPLNLSLNVINILVCKVARFANIVVALELFQVGEIESFGSAFANDCDRRVLKLALFDLSCQPI